MLRKKVIALVMALASSSFSYAMSMQELFDSVNAQGNVSNPAVLQGQTMNLYTGGSLFMRMPKRAYQLATSTPPSWGAGCGGIDLYMGGFSYINKEQFVAMMRNIGSNALGYGFKLAIQNLCPTCDNVMQALQATAQQINRLNMDSCEAAKGIVNAALPNTWERGKQNAAKNYGVDMNLFENITDAWTNVMNNERKANEPIERAKNTRPEARDALPSGNVVWKALKKLDGITDEHRMILMSMMGSTIFSTDTLGRPRALIPKEITVEELVGARSTSDQITVPIWRCDTTSTEGCLHPVEDTITVKSFKAMVRQKMGAISGKIADRSAYDDMTAVLGFLNATDLPVYKMLAVTTTMGNTSLADALISRYADLIAAKYAEIYIQRALIDLRAAIDKFSIVSDASQNEVLEDLKPKLESTSRAAKQVLATAYSQTVSTYNIAQEVRHMERVMNANLSQTLRASLAFGKSLR
ncbi:TraH protein precursor (plasmid) [Mycetohabitans rhizoxinica HKI 454]|uniref:TraH protein n=1 Tax=Mycetohabitans rhizoxinica (strain DSM 19002 / CIP 109453 / HKI 454) TaxID=882378 RepID=E5AW08_MYCRK|nr:MULTISPECIES: conjugal transfer protein TraH [Mycetohabitans]MCG1048720.1 conjugal transfer protein TraH [Mycetohabitans sp. B6]CBW77310.1 TraH protein precursor [Mycetohabitans rhizoxinica HKI 454]